MRSGRLWCWSCAVWSGEGTGYVDHLRFISCVPAHVRFDLPRRLAGVLELSKAPHHLDEVVTRVFVVVAAGVRHAHVFTPVGALAALARQPQPGVVPLPGDDHGARVLGLGFKFDGIIPDALSLGLGRPKAAGDQQQQSAVLGPHGVRWMLSVRGGEWDCSS